MNTQILIASLLLSLNINGATAAGEESSGWTPTQKYCHNTCTQKHCGKSEENWNTCWDKCSKTTDTINLIPNCVKGAAKANYITPTQCKYLHDIPMYEDVDCKDK